MQCAGCQKPIADRYMYMVQERMWHGACILCAECRTVLRERCYHRDGKFFCRNDFFRLFGTPCSGCSQGIAPDRLIHRVQSRVYHVECLSCRACGRKLETGDTMRVNEEGALLCRCSFGVWHADGRLDMTNTTNRRQLATSADVFGEKGTERDNAKDTASSGEADSHEGDRGGSSDSEKLGNEGSQSTTPAPEGKRRGPRTTIKAKQLEMLKSAFSQAPKPSRQARERLAKETGLSMRVIQVWFQNRRSKERRMKQVDNIGKNLLHGQQPGVQRRSQQLSQLSYPPTCLHQPGNQGFYLEQQAGGYHPSALQYPPTLQSMTPAEQIPTVRGPLTSYYPQMPHPREPSMQYAYPYSAGYQTISHRMHSQSPHIPPSQSTDTFRTQQHLPPSATLQQTAQTLEQSPPNLPPLFQPPEISAQLGYHSNPPQPWTTTPHSQLPTHQGYIQTTHKN